jgi:hypothetical protein
VNFDLFWKRIRKRPVLLDVSTGNGLVKGRPVQLTPVQMRELLRQAFESGTTSTRVRNRIVGMLTRGMSVCETAKRAKVAKRTVAKISYAMAIQTPGMQRRERNRKASGRTVRVWKCGCGNRTQEGKCLVCAARGIDSRPPADAYRVA